MRNLNLTSLSLQEIFNKSANHLLLQAEKSTNTGSNSPIEVCQYRGPNGLQCAAGPLISGDQYRDDMEKKSFTSVNVEYGLGYGPTQAKLISALQGVHDTNPPKNWPERLMWVAARFNLVMVPVPAGWTPKVSA